MQETLTLDETIAAMQTAGCRARVQAAFVDLKEVKRYEMLGSRTNFEGLVRTSKDKSGSIYETILSC